MFVESKADEKNRILAWLEAQARSRPGAFTAVLILLAVGVTIGLMIKSKDAVVLYQGF